MILPGGGELTRSRPLSFWLWPLFRGTRISVYECMLMFLLQIHAATRCTIRIRIFILYYMLRAHIKKNHTNNECTIHMRIYNNIRGVYPSRKCPKSCAQNGPTTIVIREAKMFLNDYTSRKQCNKICYVSVFDLNSKVFS